MKIPEQSHAQAEIETSMNYFAAVEHGRPVLIASMFVLAFMIACGDNRESTNYVLRVGNDGEPKALDPHIVTGVVEERILSALFEGLVNFEFESMTPIPGVASAWEVSDDGAAYTFHLNPAARWSNGDPVTAQHFVYSWQRILTPELGAEYAYLLYPLKNAERFHRGALKDFSGVGVRAVDDHTLAVELESPTPYFLALQIHFAWYPVHPPSIESHRGPLDRGGKWTRPGTLVSNGPFVLAEWRPNDVVEVQRNPHYWDAARVGLDGVAFFPVAEPSVEERLFRAGDLHITYELPLTKVRAYQRNNPDVLRLDPYLATEFIRFNTTRPPFDNVRVRRAFSLAIDREQIVNRVLQGGEQSAHHFTPPDTAGYTCTTRVPFDPEQARALLAEAGYPDGKDFPAVELLYDSGDNQRIYCEALQHQWKTHLGIEVALLNRDHKTWLADMIGLNYDLARSYWLGDYADPSNFLEMFYAASGNNRTGFNSETYDELVRQAVRTPDVDARYSLYQQAEAMLLTEAIIAPVYFHTRAYLCDPHVENLSANALGRIPWKSVRLAE